MALDPWAIDAQSGTPGYSAQETRLSTVTALSAGAGVALGARSGVRHSGSASGAGTDLLVQAQSSPNMTVKVNTGCIVVQGATTTTQGTYTWALDSITNVTIAAAHATLDRIDLIVVRVRDGNVDTSGAGDGGVIAITGTNGGGVPALPSDATYFTLAQIAVTHAHTTIVSGDITDKRVFTSANGGHIPCVSTARPTNVIPGQRIYEFDTGLWYWWSTPLAKWMRELQDLQLTSQFSSTGTGFTDLAGFTFAAEANSTYRIHCWLSTSAPTAFDLSLQWVLPASASVEWTLSGPSSTDAGTTVTTTVWQGVISTTGPLTVGGMNSTGASAQIFATVTIAGTAGTVKIQGAQAVAGGTSFVRTASWMSIKQLT